MGSTSTKRNICSLTDSSAMEQERMRSSHQRRSNMEGAVPANWDQSRRPSSCVSASMAASISAGGAVGLTAVAAAAFDRPFPCPFFEVDIRGNPCTLPGGSAAAFELKTAAHGLRSTGSRRMVYQRSFGGKYSAINSSQYGRNSSTLGRSALFEYRSNGLNFLTQRNNSRSRSVIRCWYSPSRWPG